MNGIQGQFTYLSENIRNNNEKKILYNIYKKYGPLYLLQACSKKKLSNDIKNTYYYPALIQEAEFQPTELTEIIICNELPKGRFTSFRFFIHRKTTVNSNIFQIRNSDFKIDIKTGGLYFQNSNISEDQFVKPTELTYQVNIGWTNDDDLIIEWFQDENYNGIINLSTLTQNKEALITYQEIGYMAFNIFDNSEITFTKPNKYYISDEFLNNYN